MDNFKVNQEERAFHAWEILTRYSRNQSTITYKELGTQMGVHHRTCRFFLDHIQNYCLKEKLPPLTILVVNQKGEVGNGFIAWDTNNFEEGFKQVCNFNWSNHLNPFSYSVKGIRETEIVRKLINREVENKEIYSLVKVRGVIQSIFRKALLEVYENKCAFCRISISEILDAAHIVPWSECNEDEKININNGILLCSNHHKMFDMGLIIIDQDYTIQVKQSLTLKISGRKIKLPKDKYLYPSKEFLQRKENSFILLLEN
jgi:putative restriction endonuclease